VGQSPPANRICVDPGRELNLVSLPMGYLAGQCKPYGKGKSKAYKDGGTDSVQRTTVSLALATMAASSSSVMSTALRNSSVSPVCSTLESLAIRLGKTYGLRTGAPDLASKF
jgi:hypothetical protein